MGNAKASSVAPLSEIDDAGSIELGYVELGSEQARNFHFAVTWVALFAHLDPIESTGPWRPRVEKPVPTLALVPVVATPPPMQPRPDQDSAAWEMVVPKMIRTSQRTFLPAENTGPGHKKPELL